MLGLEENVRELEDFGYTVIRDCFSDSECDEIVAAIKHDKYTQSQGASLR